MASCDSSLFEYKYFNGNWSGWRKNSSTSLSEGYAGSKKYVVYFYFKTPAASGAYKNTKLSITIPWVRQTQETSGTLYIKLYKYDSTTDPKAGSTTIGTVPNSSNYDAEASWSATDREVHTSTFKIEGKSIDANTGYYIAIGCSIDFLEIGYSSNGYSSEYDHLYAVSFDYTTYTLGGNPSISISNPGNNNYTISGNLGKKGTNNDVSSATLYYTTNGNNPDTSVTPGTTKNGTTAVVITNPSSEKAYSHNGTVTANTTVKAVIKCNFASNSTTASASVSISYYHAPGAPGKPKLSDSSYKNKRLTVKKDWGWTWGLSTPYNTSAHNAVDGYRIRFYKNDKVMHIKHYSLGTIITTDVSGNGDYAYDRSASYDLPMPMKAADQEVIPGDYIKLSVQAYIVNGAGTKLFSTESISDNYLVQNAGVIRVNIGGVWREGTVSVYANGKWNEAETVNVWVKETDDDPGRWREST